MNLEPHYNSTTVAVFLLKELWTPQEDIDQASLWSMLHGDRDRDRAGNSRFPKFEGRFVGWDVPKYPTRDVSRTGNGNRLKFPCNIALPHQSSPSMSSEFSAPLPNRIFKVFAGLLLNMWPLQCYLSRKMIRRRTGYRIPYNVIKCWSQSY